MVGADGVVTLVTFFESHTHGVVCAEPWIPSARRGSRRSASPLRKAPDGGRSGGRSVRRRVGSGVDQRISEETEQVAPEAVVAASMSHGPFPPCRRPNRTPKPGPDSPLSPRATVILEPHRLPNRFPTLAQQKPRLQIRE